jgi:hypothetical protein
MKVLVCGGRDFNSLSLLYRELEKLEVRPSQIISGHARGADQLAEMYAREYNIPLRIFPANWDKYGKRAGYIRNKQMLDEGEPDLVVAFPGGRGTDMMVMIAESANIPVIKVKL